MKKIIETYVVMVFDETLDNSISLSFDSYYNAENFSEEVLKNTCNSVKITRVEKEMQISDDVIVGKFNELKTISRKLIKNVKDLDFYEQEEEYTDIFKEIFKEIENIEV